MQSVCRTFPYCGIRQLLIHSTSVLAMNSPDGSTVLESVTSNRKCDSVNRFYLLEEQSCQIHLDPILKDRALGFLIWRHLQQEQEPQGE